MFYNKYIAGDIEQALDKLKLLFEASSSYYRICLLAIDEKYTQAIKQLDKFYHKYTLPFFELQISIELSCLLLESSFLLMSGDNKAFALLAKQIGIPKKDLARFESALRHKGLPIYEEFLSSYCEEVILTYQGLKLDLMQEDVFVDLGIVALDQTVNKYKKRGKHLLANCVDNYLTKMINVKD